MQSFQVQQAIFASADRGSMKGYQIVARSAGVDRYISQTLHGWAPTQMPDDAPGAWTINYFPVNDQKVAITRTVLGGPEYSSRGGFEVVTLILLLSNEQFGAYQSNPILVAKTAIATGTLRLPLQIDGEYLPPANLPCPPLVYPPPPVADDQSHATDRHHLSGMLDRLAKMVNQRERIAVIGQQNPIAVVEHLLPRLSEKVRREFSFTTGLLPTVRRPFQAHFLATADLSRQRTLESQNIHQVHLSA